MAASNRPLGSAADGGSTRWAAGEAAWDAARTLFRVDGGWGARERARSNLHMNTDGQG